MSPRTNTFTRFKYWIPAIFVALLISLFSTRYFTEENTSEIILPVLRWLLPWADTHILHLLHVGIRKTAHFVEFGAFSVLVFRGLRGDRRGWRLSWAFATLLIAAAYASIDEWHQSFVPLRHPSARDVAIDTTGALLSQIAVWGYATRKEDSAAGRGPRRP
jgi:VanZ family protein